MPAHYWANPTEQHRWHSKCDWDFAPSADSGLEAKLEKIYGVKSGVNEAAHAKHPYGPCCGVRYKPWGKGNPRSSKSTWRIKISTRWKPFFYRRPSSRGAG